MYVAGKKCIVHNFFITFAPKILNKTLQKWIRDRAVHGFPMFSIEDVRKANIYSSEQILQNELSRLCSNPTLSNFFGGVALQ